MHDDMMMIRGTKIAAQKNISIVKHVGSTSYLDLRRGGYSFIGRRASSVVVARDVHRMTMTTPGPPTVEGSRVTTTNASDAPSSSWNTAAGAFYLRLASGTLSVGGGAVPLFDGVSDVFHCENASAHAASVRGCNPKSIDAAVMGFNTDATATATATANATSAASAPGSAAELSTAKKTRKSRHVVTLATSMPGVSRFMACARCKLWWMTPSWGTEVTEVPAETQFLLLELTNGAGYVVLLPMISDDGFRATLSG